MKIPTMLGLALLIIAIFLGVYLFKVSEVSTKIAFDNLAPQEIQAVNVTDTSATIIWQTIQPATGLVSFGSTESLGDAQNDDRDQDNPKPHLVHFVTIDNLKPATQYFFKARSSTYFYPDKPLTFKTAPASSVTQKSAASLNKPIFGVVLDSNLNPVDEAIVILRLPGASTLATLTITAGNFILPLVDLKTQDLSSDYKLDQKTDADLIIGRANVLSDIKIRVPVGDSPLPKIVLGRNSDFSGFEASPSAKLNILDINSDGFVNTLDKSIVIDNIGRKKGDPGYNPAADLNNDNIVDQKDLNIIKSVVK